jgi:hypothetical protein
MNCEILILPRAVCEKTLIGVLVGLPICISLVTACTRPASRGELIGRYSEAQCVPVKLAAGSPATREWNYRLMTRAGSAVTVRGSQRPGGRIMATFGPDPRPAEIANPGDYIYPSDVRVDASNDRLYVKATGVAAGSAQPQTWLFEYDLAQRQQVRRLLVDPSVLPPDCPVSTSNPDK